ncbi:MAG: hypothetical protein GY760_21230 [Deltaproteobacteria bacterium]|nr:hypothetical protein [Deltaproteobacteria bacterium]
MEAKEKVKKTKVKSTNSKIVELNGKKYKDFTHDMYDDFDEEEIEFTYKFRKATSGEVSRAQSKMGKKSSQAFQNLCVSTCHPEDKERLLADLKSYPGLTTTFGNKILEMAGFGDLGNS